MKQYGAVSPTPLRIYIFIATEYRAAGKEMRATCRQSDENHTLIRGITTHRKMAESLVQSTPGGAAAAAPDDEIGP